VNPHDVTGSHALQEGAKDSLKHCAMQCPWKLKKIVTKAAITSQTRKYKNGLRRELPCDVS